MERDEWQAQIAAAKAVMHDACTHMWSLDDELRQARIAHAKAVNTYDALVRRMERQIGHDAMVARLQQMAA